jgi:hypothetical protein
MAYNPTTIGQTTMANSSPVTIASDQTPFSTSEAPDFVVITGDPTGDFAGVNLLEAAADPSSGVNLNVNVINRPKADLLGAAIPSDCPQVITLSGGASQTLIVDTQGYSSFTITSQAMVANVFASNDLITFSALSIYPVVIGTPVTAFAANTNYTAPCVGRYLKFTITTAGTATLYLRSKAFDGAYQTQQGFNLVSYGGTAVVTAGVAGMPAVGGNIAAGVAPTANPVLVGGIDTGGLTRRVLTDTTGRVAVSASVSAGNLGAAQSPQNIAALATQDQTILDGSLVIELLQQLLIEARVANYQRHEFNFGTGQQSDDPTKLRDDPTLTLIN